jgi:hypothetical protein
MAVRFRSFHSASMASVSLLDFVASVLAASPGTPVLSDEPASPVAVDVAKNAVSTTLNVGGTGGDPTFVGGDCEAEDFALADCGAGPGVDSDGDDNVSCAFSCKLTKQRRD